MGDIPWGTLTCKVTGCFNHLFLWVHAANQVLGISLCRRPMDTKLGKVLT